ncbi:hypothetical protein C8F01DRAFT_1366566 [Mycena amicta]|nr:hypothetical protein C8F01DRAFT_1366566 [Mycena amicta]
MQHTAPQPPRNPPLASKFTREQACYLTPNQRFEYWLDALATIVTAPYSVKEYQGAARENKRLQAQLLENVQLFIIDLTNAINRRQGLPLVPRLDPAESIFKISRHSSGFSALIFERLRALLGLRMVVQGDACEAAHNRCLDLMSQLGWPEPEFPFHRGPAKGEEDPSLATSGQCMSLVCTVHPRKDSPAFLKNLKFKPKVDHEATMLEISALSAALTQSESALVQRKASANHRHEHMSTSASAAGGVYHRLTAPPARRAHAATPGNNAPVPEGHEPIQLQAGQHHILKLPTGYLVNFNGRRVHLPLPAAPLNSGSGGISAVDENRERVPVQLPCAQELVIVASLGEYQRAEERQWMNGLATGEPDRQA